MPFLAVVLDIARDAVGDSRLVDPGVKSEKRYWLLVPYEDEIVAMNDLLTVGVS